MDPERQQLLGTHQPEIVQVIYNHGSIEYPASLQGKVPPDRFYHTMERLNHTFGPTSRWSKIFVLAVILLIVGILMPFAMLRWFTPRHFPVRMWIPIDSILVVVTLGLGILMYIRSRRIRAELAKIVKKENKKCYHRTGVHLRFEPGGVATRPYVVIEHIKTASDRAADYGSHQARQAPPAQRSDRAPAARAPPEQGSRLPSPPPFRQQHSFYEEQQHSMTPQQYQQQQQVQQQQMQQQMQMGPSPPISPRYQQHQPVVLTSPPMSPRQHYQQQQGPPPPSNYAPPQSHPSKQQQSYDGQTGGPPDGYGQQGSYYSPPGTNGGGYHAAEFTSVPVRDVPSQRQQYDLGEGSYSPTPQKRTVMMARDQQPSPSSRQPPPRQPSYPQQQQQQGRQGGSPRQGAPNGHRA